MYGIFTYIYHKFKPNVGKYTTIHGSYGLVKPVFVRWSLQAMPLEEDQCNWLAGGLGRASPPWNEQQVASWAPWKWMVGRWNLLEGVAYLQGLFVSFRECIDIFDSKKCTSWKKLVALSGSKPWSTCLSLRFGEFFFDLSPDVCFDAARGEQGVLGITLQSNFSQKKVLIWYPTLW